MAKRIEQLDGVRTLAIIAVFIHHALHVKLLWAGVDLFFILSGFLITGILLGKKDDSLGGYLGHFYERRARRILPSYAIFLMLVSIFLGVGWASHWYRFLFLMNFNLAFHTAGIPQSMDILWSLAVEEQFYMVWPFAIFFLSETAVAWVAGGLLLVTPLLRWEFTPFFSAHWQIYALTPFRMDLLAMGALIAVIWRRRRASIERYGVFGPLLTAGALAALWWFSRNSNFSTDANTRAGNVWIYELTLLASTGVILFALSGRYVGLLKWGPIAYIGRISYTIYLMHLLILELLWRFVHSELATAAIAAAVVTAYASLSWAFLEQPILYWKPRSRVRAEADADEKAVAS